MDPITTATLTAALCSAIDWAAEKAKDHALGAFLGERRASEQLRQAFENAEHRAQKGLSPRSRAFLETVDSQAFSAVSTAVVQLSGDLDGSYLRAEIEFAVEKADFLDQYRDVRQEISSAYYEAILTALAGSENPVQSPAKLLWDKRNHQEGLVAIRDRKDEDHAQSLLALAEEELERGKQSAASKLLTEVARVRIESSVLRAQAHYLRARVAHRRDEFSPAAANYFEAARLQPTDLRMRAGAVWAHELLNEKPQAGATARTLIADFPGEPIAWARFLRYPANREEFDRSIEQALKCGEHVELRVAIAQAAMEQSDFDLALEHVQSGLRRWPQDWRLVLLYPDILLATYQTSLESDATRSSRRALEIEQAATRAMAILRSREDVDHFQAKALVMRGLAHQHLGKPDDAAADFLQAQSLAPDIHEVRARAGWALLHRKNVDGAIDLLSRSDSPEPAHSFFLAHALVTRGDEADLAKAIHLLEPLVKDVELPFQHEALFLALQALSNGGTTADLLAFLDECADALPEATVLWARATAWHQSGDREQAAEAATAAASVLTETTPIEVWMRLATLLCRLGCSKPALPIWKHLFDLEKGTLEAKELLHCALAVNDHEAALECLETWRLSGKANEAPRLVFTEAGLLTRYDADSAIAILRQFLQDNPTNCEARMRLLLAAVHLGRDDVVPECEGDLPNPDEISPSDGRSVAKALRATGKWDDAVRYAYQLGRSFADDADAQVAIRDAILFSNGRVPLLDVPSSVDEVTAVRYSLDGKGDQNWYVLEAESPKGSNSEVSPSSPVGERLLGRRVGDKFTISETFGIEKVATIQELKSKYLHRLHEVMERHEERFPEKTDMVAFAVPTTSDGEFDVEAFFAVLERSSAPITRLMKLHETAPLPVPVFALSNFSCRCDGMLRLVNADGPGPRCSRGSVPERHEAVEALGASSPIVLDLSAAMTVFLSGSWGLLREPRVIVASSTLETLVRWARPPFDSVPPNNVLYHGAEWGSSPKGFNDRLHEFIEALRAQVTVHKSRALASVDSESRTWMDETIGPDCAAAIALANSVGGLLWVDDLLAGLFFKEKFGGRYAWTQVVASELGRPSNLLTEEETGHLTACLLGWQYRFTSVNGSSVMAAAHKACWEPSGWPLRGTLRYLGSSDVRPDDAIGLGRTLLQGAAINITVKEKRQEFVIEALKQISLHPRGWQIVNQIGRQLRVNPSLAVIAEQDVVETIAAWLAGSRGRVILG